MAKDINLTIIEGQLKSKKLIEKTAKIKAYENGVKTSLFGIAHIMQEIEKEELYKADGFKSVVEYAEKVFGYKKTMVYNMLKVAENYLQAGENKTVFATGEKDFSMGQVQELLALPAATSKELVKTGKINSDMTAKEIRDIVKENKPQKEKKNDTKTAAKNSSQQEKKETPAKENKHVKKIEKIFKEIKTLVNSIEGENNNERKELILGNLVLLQKEIGF